MKKPKFQLLAILSLFFNLGLGLKNTELLGHHKEAQTFKITNLISKLEEGCFFLHTVIKKAAVIFYMAPTLLFIKLF